MTNTPSAAIAANIRAEMARAGVSQTKLAGHLEISQNAVSARLRGTVSLRLDELYAIAEFIGVDVESLMKGAA